MTTHSEKDQNAMLRFTSRATAIFLCGMLAACKGPTEIPKDDPPPSAAQVEIVPGVLTIEPDGEVQLSATVRDASGAAITGAEIAWSVSPDGVATVSDRGVLKALAPGAATVSAAVDGSSGHLILRVEEPATRTGAGPNEPAGFFSIADRGYASVEEGGWIRKISTNFVIAEDADAPVSGPMVGEAVYDAGFDGGEAPVATDRWIRDYYFRSVYLSFAIKLSDNWQGGANGGNIFGYIWLNNNPGVVPTYVGSSGAQLIPQVRLHGTPMPPDGAVNLAPNVETPVIQRGKWHRWEVLVVMNDKDQLNGQVHWWVDGVKAGEYTNIAFTPDPAAEIWQYVTWRPIWSTPGDVVQETMSMKLDHYYVSGRRF